MILSFFLDSDSYSWYLVLIEQNAIDRLRLYCDILLKFDSAMLAYFVGQEEEEEGLK